MPSVCMDEMGRTYPFVQILVHFLDELSDTDRERVNGWIPMSVGILFQSRNQYWNQIHSELTQ